MFPLNSIRLKVLILFFFSGFSALVLEVVWAKQTCLIFGNTTLAYAAITAAFMLGLAVGSYYFGKVADKYPSQCLRLYAYLEGLIGLFAIFFPFLLKTLTPIYQHVYTQHYENFWTLSVIRFVLSFLVFAIPTILMGGTFPLLVKFLSLDPKTNENDKASPLYTANLLGAASGAYASGFFLAGAIGFYPTSLVAAFINLSIFIWVALSKPTNSEQPPLSASIPSAKQGPAFPDSSSARSHLLLLTVFMAIHGFCVFVIQIAWTRTMILMLGSSTYSFSAVLTTFLLGLGAGSFFIGYLAQKKKSLSLKSLGYLEAIAGLSVLLFTPLFEHFLYIFIRFFPLFTISDFTVSVTRFIFCALTMSGSTFLMGMIFPAAINYVAQSKDVGKTTGTLYAVNTMGSVLGSAAAALVLIPALGVNNSLKAAGIVMIFFGLLIVLRDGSKEARAKNIKYSALILAAAALFSFYQPNKYLFSSGAFIYASTWTKFARYGKDFLKAAMGSRNNLAFYKEGVSSTVTVSVYKLSEKVEAKSLRVNGKTDASTHGDMPTQLFLGYLPIFAHPDPKDVMVIGLGSGMTLKAVAQLDSVKRIDCIEIEPAVVEANRFFSLENNNVLKDPRVKVIIGDGRNHAAFSKEKYDVIISEPSNPWISGISSLFTREMYQSALSRMQPDGIFCQWIHGYQMSVQDFKMLIKTFLSVFPYVNLYQTTGGDYCLVGRQSEFSYDLDRILKEMEKNPLLKKDLEVFSPLASHFFLSFFIASDSDLRTALAKEKNLPINSDDHLHLEFNAPKYMYQNTGDQIQHWLYSMPKTSIFPRMTPQTRREWLKSEKMYKFLMYHSRKHFKARNYSKAAHLLRQASRIIPDKPEPYYLLGNISERQSRFQTAMRWYEKTRGEKVWDNFVQYAHKRAQMLYDAQNRPSLKKNVVFLNMISNLSFLLGDFDASYEAMGRALYIDPNYAKNYADMAIFSIVKKDMAGVIESIKTAEKLNPTDPYVVKAKERAAKYILRENEKKLLQIGKIQFLRKNYKAAEKIFSRILERDPENIQALISMTKVEEALGDFEATEKYKKRAVDQVLKNKLFEDSDTA